MAMEEKKTRKTYSLETRRDIARLVIEGGRDTSSVAKEYGVSLASVYAWVKRAQLAGLTASGSSEPSVTALQQDVVRLRKQLKEANDRALFLQKTSAFFANLKK